MTTSLPESYQSSFKLPPLQPDLAFVHSRFAHFLAFGAGVGLSRLAPGTFGTLVAFPLFWSLDSFLEPIALLLAIDIFFILGIWACAITGRALRAHDHPGMVWDEIVAFMLVLYFIPDHWLWSGAAFILFRFFDILKPPPIKYYERKLRGGLGVMFDDLLAAFYTLLCLAGWKSLVLFESYF
ncbi:phosphatidylglycerophosphatase A [Nitrosomonas sp. Nm132]|uniref:phosphatidylglycerophosphatase A family protein n=1 Tax=Nitrosomonas sp. Nm132 TaxID=1881053 RepID=UPI000881F882|nr:phosphatidylglycerophosphatase A [Nitrosomonas sp. Nm132]SDG94091.1 phosphatidylglycerophosphatase A [Nitrosomonas sp. Nm132]